MGEVVVYTQDGTVDSKGKPAMKKNTGNWRACPYILGTYTHDSIVVLLCSAHDLLVYVHPVICMEHGGIDGSLNELQGTNAARGWRTTA